ncbi:sulfite exporter TauE/SafE family protein [Candidatus Sororendozoicomonas aggregata]|uniref:sulfite exporter TauE/SafE family protein n=1 Tax=Candidatus Sororendozoicomonas aggregata TaxID=3073239 RepID=UPI002ED5C7A8
MISNLPLLISAFTLGLLGSAHCIGMCGGITSALSLSIPKETRMPSLLLMSGYHWGRISSYAVAGFVLGAAGWFLGDSSATLKMSLRFIAGGMLVAMGLYLSGLWRGLTRLEKAGSLLWRYIQPVANRLLPIRSLPRAMAVGALWGWLPCGLVYSTLIWSASQGEPQLSALLMLCFGLGTTPAVLLTGLFSKQLNVFIQSQCTRNIAAAMMVAFGLWTMPGPHTSVIMHLLHHH